ncbi:MAG: NAD(P)-dependent oxidoreductase, partial [Myxococcales bacterium]|nr:NAD(P)-dependent oxidoreductase [Myxococcales bacterium]
ILHAGPRGHGATLKLVVNALFAGQVALMAELLRAAEAHGLEPAHTAALLAKMPVTSPAAAGAAALMVAGDHAPRFPVDLVEKDLGYAAALGRAPVTEAVRSVFAAARAAGLGDRNLTVVHRPSAAV